MVWKHIDLFSGYGGFAYAFREVFGDEGKTILFCDNDKYCQVVLRRHWSEVSIWEDIRELIADTKKSRRTRKTAFYSDSICQSNGGTETKILQQDKVILTGGFPCQPFSQAGKRRGKGDDRFLWPEMLECIKLFKPAWVIAENVYGILNIEGGMVFEQVCSDMEKEGYEVWPFIIPACAVNAPHRRDRVWIVAYDENKRCGRSSNNGWDKERKNTEKHRIWDGKNDAPIPTSKGLERETHKEGQGSRFDREEWDRDWKEVATSTCVRGVDDGITQWMDEVRISQAKHRTERLKMCGNGIVPQVAMEIMRVIKDVGNG